MKLIELRELFFIFIFVLLNVLFHFVINLFGFYPNPFVNFFVIGYYYYRPLKRPAQIKKEFAQYEPPRLGFKDKFLAKRLELQPSLKFNIRQPIKSLMKNYILCAENKGEFLDVLTDSAKKILSKKELAVVVIGGLRGAGKSTSTENISEKLSGEVGTILMDAYFKEPTKCKAVGGWDNPRNSDIPELVQAVKAFKRGKMIRVRTGRIPDIKETIIDPKKTPCLVIEGIHALLPAVSKHADLRCLIYVPPGLQEIRTWMRDLLKQKAKQKTPEYYLGMNARVREMQRIFVLPRIVDVDILYEQKLSDVDLDALARMLNLSEKEKIELRDAWKIGASTE